MIFYSATSDLSKPVMCTQDLHWVGVECMGWYTHYVPQARWVCGRTGKDATPYCKLHQTKAQAKLSRYPSSTETGSLSWSTTTLGHRSFSLSSVAFPSLLWNRLYLGVTWLLTFQTLYLSARGSKHLRFSSWSGNSLVTFLKNKSKLNKVKG